MGEDGIDRERGGADDWRVMLGLEQHRQLGEMRTTGLVEAAAFPSVAVSGRGYQELGHRHPPPVLRNQPSRAQAPAPATLVAYDIEHDDPVGDLAQRERALWHDSGRESSVPEPCTRAPVSPPNSPPTRPTARRASRTQQHQEARL